MADDDLGELEDDLHGDVNVATIMLATSIGEWYQRYQGALAPLAAAGACRMTFSFTFGPGRTPKHHMKIETLVDFEDDAAGGVTTEGGLGNVDG